MTVQSSCFGHLCSKSVHHIISRFLLVLSIEKAPKTKDVKGKRSKEDLRPKSETIRKMMTHCKEAVGLPQDDRSIYMSDFMGTAQAPYKLSPPNGHLKSCFVHTISVIHVIRPDRS